MSSLGANIARLGLAELERWLADPLGLESISKLSGGKRLRVVVRADVPYAAYVEYGTRYHAAHPFMRPAARRANRAFGLEVKARLRKWN
jgi:HK97 gp10 family phage protein